VVLCALIVSGCRAQPADPELQSWEARAANVTITRDIWGIPHVTGQSDADAVFGFIYAQAEDDFNRIEANYLTALGRLAEADGEKELFQDLRARLFIETGDLKAQYSGSPDNLKALMNAWADGLNFYLRTHPQVKPRVLTHFEPWMALSFTEGSIGGDLERVSLRELEAFYGERSLPHAPRSTARVETDPPEPGGSNGFAVAPSNSATGHALLWINPHTTFYFRAEAQITSGEALNAYGAATWGQFFIYQGFNEKAGWMHTTSGVDDVDEYLEEVQQRGDQFVYRYGADTRPVIATDVDLTYATPQGPASRRFTVYHTHHGPVVRREGDAWVAVRMMHEPVKALTESFMRMKATNYRAFRDTLELHTNSSNNTVFADADGDIAYFHANFIPKRDPRFDWTKPVDGTDPATEWHGVLSVDESPNVFNPPNGWIQNTNNWPFSAAGANSPKRADYPAYVETGGENPRGIHAMRVLGARHDFTIDTLAGAAFDSALPEFDVLLPTLIKAYDALPATDARRHTLEAPVSELRSWDHRWSLTSVPTTLAVLWGEQLWTGVTASARKAGLTNYEFMETRASADERLNALVAVVDRLTADFGTWAQPWGEMNRYQRLTGALAQPFDDTKPSRFVPFTSSRWGSLASFGARRANGTKYLYGTTGNSFLAAVDFGARVRAKAVMVGGESGDPKSRHFSDQADRYITGDLRDVYFYPEELRGHIERQYHPGER
jgi:acyl-homoserine-lactone acylase